MKTPPAPRRFSAAELILAALGFSALTLALTYPLVFHLTTLVYRLDNGDGQFSVWNVAWVAHALTTNPIHVFDANIFAPHRWTLFYSETNLAAGALGTPVYWITHNAFATHSVVVLLSFVLAALAMYALALYLVEDRRAAAVAAICFAFCPRAFSRLLQIQLLMTAGIPLVLLAFHRLLDQPTVRRGAVLGAVMALEAYACGYYTVFVVMLVGFAVLWMAVWRRVWGDAHYWISVGCAAAVAAVLVAPVALPYLKLQRQGLERPLDAARSYGADWQAYLASAAFAHAWMLPHLKHWSDVLFPGFVALGFGLAGGIWAWRQGGRQREVAAFYLAIGGLAAWESIGPAGGLYSVSYHLVPGFSFLRVPTHFAVLVILSLSVLAGYGVSRCLALVRPALQPALATIVVLLAVCEAITPLAFSPAPAPDPAYQQLAGLPRGNVLELPLYSSQFAFLRAGYMLNSTIHWMPIVNAYSDLIPQDLVDSQEALGAFPTLAGFARARYFGVRYVVFHLDQYGPQRSAVLRDRLHEFSAYLHSIRTDGSTWVFEIAAFPDR